MFLFDDSCRFGGWVSFETSCRNWQSGGGEGFIPGGASKNKTEQPRNFYPNFSHKKVKKVIMDHKTFQQIYSSYRFTAVHKATQSISDVTMRATTTETYA